jgi:hypothetical protein
MAEVRASEGSMKSAAFLAVAIAYAIGYWFGLNHWHPKPLTEVQFQSIRFYPVEFPAGWRCLTLDGKFTVIDPKGHHTLVQRGTRADATQAAWALWEFKRASARAEMANDESRRKYNLHCHLIGGHGLCRVLPRPDNIKASSHMPPPPDSNSFNLFEDNVVIGVSCRVEFEDGFVTDVHPDALMPARMHPFPAKDPTHAWVQNNGGFLPPTTNVLCLPDGQRIPFPLNTTDPMQWARDWLAANAPEIPLHPDFVVTM